MGQSPLVEGLAAVLGVRTDRPVEVKNRRRWIRDRAGVHSSWDECSAPTARAQQPRPVYLVLTPTNCETHEQHTSAHLGARESLDIAQIERVQQQAPFVKAQGVE